MDLLERTKEDFIKSGRRRKEMKKRKNKGQRDNKRSFNKTKKLKRRKAPEEDSIENEAWRYMSTEIGEALWKLVNNIWKKGEVPEDLEQRYNQSNM